MEPAFVGRSPRTVVAGRRNSWWSFHSNDATFLSKARPQRHGFQLHAPVGYEMLVHMLHSSGQSLGDKELRLTAMSLVHLIEVTHVANRSIAR